jgi:hypothetical protein
MRAMVLILSVLVLSACSGYRSNPGDGELGFGPPTASGGSYQRDGFYDGGAFDLDITSPRPGDMQ